MPWCSHRSFCEVCACFLPHVATLAVSLYALSGLLMRTCHQPEKLSDLAGDAHIRLYCSEGIGSCRVKILGRVIRRKCRRIEDLYSFLQRCSFPCCTIGRVLHANTLGGYCLILCMRVMQLSSGCRQLQVVCGVYTGLNFPCIACICAFGHPAEIYKKSISRTKNISQGPDAFAVKYGLIFRISEQDKESCKVMQPHGRATQYTSGDGIWEPSWA